MDASEAGQSPASKKVVFPKVVQIPIKLVNHRHVDLDHEPQISV